MNFIQLLNFSHIIVTISKYRMTTRKVSGRRDDSMNRLRNYSSISNRRRIQIAGQCDRSIRVNRFVKTNWPSLITRFESALLPLPWKSIIEMIQYICIYQRMTQLIPNDLKCFARKISIPWVWRFLLERGGSSYGYNARVSIATRWTTVVEERRVSFDQQSWSVSNR